MKLLVTGGSGFIGRAVCRAALEAGHEVAALSRGGRPGGGEAWLDQVRWTTGDVLEPAGWRQALAGCGAVVHCVGIVRERRDRGVTFERVNGESAVVAAREAARAGVGAFVFLSASMRVPGVRRAYLDAKRRAEREIEAMPLRFAALRPGFVFGRGRWISVPAAAVMRAGLLLPTVRARLGPSRPIPVETVGRAAVRAAVDPAVRGVVDADGIERLGAG